MNSEALFADRTFSRALGKSRSPSAWSKSPLRSVTSSYIGRLEKTRSNTLPMALEAPFPVSRRALSEIMQPAFIDRSGESITFDT